MASVQNSSRLLLLCGLLLVVMAIGCRPGYDSAAIVYTAQDEEFAKPIFATFTARTGTEVLPKYDSESAKTTGLVADLIYEAARPRADVFWNNEPVGTIRLDRLGLLDVYRSLQAAAYPAEDRSPRDTWCGFAARARVLVVNTNLVKEAERPRSIEDLADPKWRGHVGMAKPLFGATATHAACLFGFWGTDKAEDYYRRLKANQIQIVAGNKQVAVNVGAGQLAFGITDTDDALEEIEHGQPVVMVYPDQQPGGIGTLFFPNTLSVIKGCPHPAAARRLIDYLLSPEVEAALSEGPSAQIPLNSGARPGTSAKKSRLETPRSISAMKVDFSAAADAWDPAMKFLKEEFTGGE
jgi:iron(III) transport system substrate-binding protein